MKTTVSAVRTSFPAYSAAARSTAAPAGNVDSAGKSRQADDAAITPVTAFNRSGGQEGSLSDEGFKPTAVENVSVAEDGVRSVSRPVDPPYLVAFNPGVAVADEDGDLAIPNAGSANEAIRLRQANTLYSTNLKVMEVTDDMMGKFLNDRA